MPQDTERRHTNTGWITAATVGALLFGVVMWISLLLPNGEGGTTAQRGAARVTTETLSEYPKLLKEWDGVIALFAPDGEQPLTVYEVNIKTLPVEEQERLRNGIVVDDEEMLIGLLENYTS